MVTQLEQFITIDRTDDDCAKVTFRAFNPDLPHANVLAVVQELIKGLTDKELTEVTCIHDYHFSPGQVSDIGCGHGAEVPNMAGYPFEGLASR